MEFTNRVMPMPHCVWLPLPFAVVAEYGIEGQPDDETAEALVALCENEKEALAVCRARKRAGQPARIVEMALSKKAE